VTAVAFHFGAPDKLAYACRLLRKATASGLRVLVVGPDQQLQPLDTLLWGVSATDFVTHAFDDAPSSVLGRSSVHMTSDVSAKDQSLAVLVNLGAQVPEEFAQFARVIEIVSTDDADRDLARQRWKHYTRLGINIQRHDLALKT
jgi:DNA polymerase-3 subunit chi